MADAARTSGRWFRRLRPGVVRGGQNAPGHLLAALDLDHVRGCLVAPSLKEVYVVGEELGEGRTAVVHEGTDKRAVGSKSAWGRCALKLFRVQDLREEDEAAEMIREEVAVLLALPRHPAVVQLLHVVSTPEVIALSLELVAGGDLFSMIEDSGPCPEGRARTLFLQVCEHLPSPRGASPGRTSEHRAAPYSAPPSSLFALTPAQPYCTTPSFQQQHQGPRPPLFAQLGARLPSPRGATPGPRSQPHAAPHSTTICFLRSRSGPALLYTP
jgi:hypothetical protein